MCLNTLRCHLQPCWFQTLNLFFRASGNAILRDCKGGAASYKQLAHCWWLCELTPALGMLSILRATCAWKRLWLWVAKGGLACPGAGGLHAEPHQGEFSAGHRPAVQKQTPPGKGRGPRQEVAPHLSEAAHINVTAVDTEPQLPPAHCQKLLTEGSKRKPTLHLPCPILARGIVLKLISAHGCGKDLMALRSGGAATRFLLLAPLWGTAILRREWAKQPWA